MHPCGKTEEIEACIVEIDSISGDGEFGWAPLRAGL
jgi:hypothetical protein